MHSSTRRHESEEEARSKGFQTLKLKADAEGVVKALLGIQNQIKPSITKSIKLCNIYNKHVRW